VGQQTACHQLHAQQLDRIGANNPLVEFNEFGMASQLYRRCNLTGIKGKYVDHRYVQNIGIGSQLLNEPFPDLDGQQPGARDDQQIVLAKTQIDIARKTDLGEHNGGGDPEPDGDSELQDHQGVAEPSG